MSEYTYKLKEKIGALKYALSEKSYVTAAANLGIPYATLKSWVDKYGDIVTDNKYKSNEEIEAAIKSLSNQNKRGPKPGTLKSIYRVVAKDERGEDGLLMVERWRELRWRKNLSIDDLARISGVSKSSINNTAGCHNPPSTKTIRKISAALGVSPEYLLYGSKEGAPVDLVAEPEEPKTTPEKRADLSDRIHALNSASPVSKVDFVTFQSAERLSDAAIEDVFSDKPIISVVKDEDIDKLKKKVLDLKEEVITLRSQMTELQDQQIKLMSLAVEIMQTQQEQARQYIAFKAKAPNGSSLYKNDNYGNSAGSSIGDSFNRDFTKKT